MRLPGAESAEGKLTLRGRHPENACESPGVLPGPEGDAWLEFVRARWRIFRRAAPSA